ncbi:MAG TPA: ATP-dependent protease ATPase subunit HslU [Fimbriimonadaceae bacterium]|nr:ATP-dependent protease ATPase subunit HslU [Fimbriimonadaceae bacterium]
MSLPIEELTPTQIVSELDRYIVGQKAAKRAVAVALRNRFRRQQLPESERDDILPKNILMIGPTGVGKTEIARRLAQLARAPFIKVEATKFTEVGYVGRDVESMVRDLAASAVRLVEREKMEAVRPEAHRRAVERLVDLLDEERPMRRRKKKATADVKDNPVVRQAFEIFGAKFDDDYPEDLFEADDSDYKRRRTRRNRIRRDIEAGALDDRVVEVETEEASNPFVQVFTPQGMEEMGLDTNQVGSPFGSKRSTRQATVKEALEILIQEEARKVVDQATIRRDAIVRTEQTGIIFLDELDKVASKSSQGAGPDVSREGVQRDLLPIIEGSTVATKFGAVRTDHILFIAAGAFHMARPSDLIPELQGRLPIRVELEGLTEEDFKRILFEPKNALTKQYEKLLSTEGIELSFTPEALDEIAKIAADVNAKTENIGARRLHTIMEKLLEDLLFEAPEVGSKSVTLDRKDVQSRLSNLAQDVDLSRYIL